MPNSQGSPQTNSASKIEKYKFHSCCLFVPVPFREEVLQLYHDNKTVEHWGRFKILDLVLRELW